MKKKIIITIISIAVLSGISYQLYLDYKLNQSIRVIVQAINTQGAGLNAQYTAWQVFLGSMDEKNRTAFISKVQELLNKPK